MLANGDPRMAKACYSLFERQYPERLGVFLFIIFTTIIGAITKGFFGRQIVKIGELLVAKTPIVRTIYNSVKQILETALKNSHESFQNACLVQYPRAGIWAVAFISTNARGEISSKINEKEY